MDLRVYMQDSRVPIAELAPTPPVTATPSVEHNEEISTEIYSNDAT